MKMQRWLKVLTGALMMAMAAMAATHGAAPALGSDVPSLTRLRSEDGYILDGLGRVTLLRGANVPGHGRDRFDFDESDLAVLESFGFNFIRLGISWSRGEPRPGEINREYLDSIREFIRAAGAYGIYVMPEVHQVGWCADDDVPEWMCEIEVDGLTDLSMLRETSRFWGDPALQERFIGFWKVLAREFRGLDNVMGYNPMNEPTDITCIVPGAFEKKLFPFYRSWIRAVRAIDPDVIAALEPGVANLMVPLKPRPLEAGNLVYAPHPYFLHTYTRRGLVVIEREGRRGLDRKYRRIAAEARELGAALLIGEYGAPEQFKWSAAWLEHSLELQDRYFAGAAIWVYNSPDSNWSIVDKEKKPRPFYWKYLHRPYPRHTSGRPLELLYSVEEKRFLYSFEPDHSIAAPTVLYVPPSLLEGGVSVEGGTWSYDRDSRLMSVSPVSGSREIVVELGGP